jgi:hypothetical protein
MEPVHDNGKHYAGYGEGFVDCKRFLAEHKRRDLHTIKEWRDFWMELDCILYKERSKDR